MNLHELASQLGLTYEGDGTWVIQSPASLEKATLEQISFIENERYYPFLKTTQAGVVIAKPEVQVPRGNVIRTPTPRLILPKYSVSSIALVCLNRAFILLQFSEKEFAWANEFI